MAKDPSKKGVRKIPQQFLDWISETYSPELAKWYKTTTGKSKALASKQRVDMSTTVGSVGAFHEGHYQGAKDFDVESQMGGGPTTGRTLRPEIGVINVAHAEMPRISKAEMKRLGIPQYWIEDFYEAILESEGMKVLGNPDVEAALDMDRGMSVEQAAAQSRLREDLRRQGAPIPGNRLVYRKNLPPLEKLPAEQVVPPEFDISEIKTTGEVKVKPRTSRIPKVPQNPYIDFTGAKAVLRTAPLLGIGATAVLASRQAMAGDLSEAAFTVGTGVIGEVPVVGDVAAEFIEGTPVASGELTPAKADPQAYVKQALQEKAQRGKEFSEFVQLAKQRPSTTVNPKELERQRRAEEARQRGGKVKFGFGGVKFTLPEFGLSELMGLN